MPNLFAKNLKLLRKKTSTTQATLALEVGKGQTTVGNWETGVSQPSFEELIILSKLFGVTIDDLLTADLAQGKLIQNQDRAENDEKGKVKGKVIGKAMDKDALSVVPTEKTVLRMPQVVTVDTSGEENTIMVPVRARAGYLNGYEDPTYIASLPAYRLPGFRNGTFRMFEVGGISMHPTLNDGDIMITQFVESLDQIRDDRIYVVVTKDHGIVVKRVLNRIGKTGVLILKSDNTKHREEYPNIIISPEDVLEIWYGVAVISRHMRAPGEMYGRLNDQEVRLTLLEAQIAEMSAKPK